MSPYEQETAQHPEQELAAADSAWTSSFWDDEPQDDMAAREPVRFLGDFGANDADPAQLEREARDAFIIPLGAAGANIAAFAIGAHPPGGSGGDLVASLVSSLVMLLAAAVLWQRERVRSAIACATGTLPFWMLALASAAG